MPLKSSLLHICLTIFKFLYRFLAKQYKHIEPPGDVGDSIEWVTNWFEWGGSGRPKLFF